MAKKKKWQGWEPPKKRGRPKKFGPGRKEFEAMKALGLVASAPKKRGRGRPRKYGPGRKEFEAQKALSGKTRKKRGRKPGSKKQTISLGLVELRVSRSSALAQKLLKKSR